MPCHNLCLVKKSSPVTTGRHYDKNSSSKVAFNNLFVIKKRYLKPEVSLTIDSHDPKLQKSLKIFPLNECDEMIKLKFPFGT